MSGNLVKDYVILENGFKAKQIFINAKTDGNLRGIKGDGVCGMGFNKLSDGIPTLIENLYN